jgi:hypothetical protein
LTQLRDSRTSHTYSGRSPTQLSEVLLPALPVHRPQPQRPPVRQPQQQQPPPLLLLLRCSASGRRAQRLGSSKSLGAKT